MRRIHELFEEQVSARPGATAITFEDDRGHLASMTNRELHKAAATLAVVLKSMG
jgi:acyl-coenzyme A synthetase/AMP-(fatty) acid ligase